MCRLIKYFIFEVLSKFVRATKISLINNNIVEIPSNAFANKQDQLNEVILCCTSFKKLGNNAFSQLNNLTELTFMLTSIDFIPEYGFEFSEQSEQQLTIDLGNNRLLNNSGFSIDTFTKLKRPTRLSFDNHLEDLNKFTYLDRKTFLPFFKSNDKNRIMIKHYHSIVVIAGINGYRTIPT